MKFIAATVLLLACASGCASVANVSAVNIRSPQGDNWIGVDCSGHSQNACLQEAGIQCPSGYDVVGNETHFATESHSSTTAVGNTLVARASEDEVHSGSMTIKCHGKSKDEIELVSDATRRAFSEGRKAGRGEFPCTDPTMGKWCYLAPDEHSTPRNPRNGTPENDTPHN